ncbi:hypothetical protein GIB67_027628, partial [Kingdonia uniflora]
CLNRFLLSPLNHPNPPISDSQFTSIATHNKERYNMLGPGFFDELDLEACGDLFEHIDGLLDFPTDFDDDYFGEKDGVSPNKDFSCGNMFSSGGDVVTNNNNNNVASELPTELSVPYDDIAQLEWLSNFVEDSFSVGSTFSARSVTVDKDNASQENHNGSFSNDSKSNIFQISSPVSVLDSSSSCSVGEKTTMPIHLPAVFPGKPRSKRPRPATFKPRVPIPVVSPTFANFPVEFGPPKKKKKLMMMKKHSPLIGHDIELTAMQPQPLVIRKCLHCEITKTPQWRAGPMGPKTLCNACGVRHKSGRLFPEYRPAASPTFVPTLHSNSHKKVVEMRNRSYYM